MNNKEEQINIVTNLGKYEQLLSQLYSIFSNLFPEYSSFWHDLSVEENTHALILATLKSMIGDGSFSFENRHFKVPDILSNVDYIKRYIESVHESHIEIKDALKFSLEIESSPLEDDVFKVYDSDPEEVKKFLKTLYEDTVRHRNKIKEKYLSL